MKSAVRIIAICLASTSISALAQTAYTLSLTQRSDDAENNDIYFETSSGCVVPGRSTGNNAGGTVNLTPNKATDLFSNNVDLNLVRFGVGPVIRGHHWHPESHPPTGGYAELEPDEPVEDLNGCTGTNIGEPAGSPKTKSILHVLISSKKGLHFLRIYFYAERYSQGSGKNHHFETFNIRTGQFPCAAMSGGGWSCDAAVSTEIEYQHNGPGESQTTLLGTRELRFQMTLMPAS